MKTQKFTPLTKDQVAYANKAVRRFLADLEEHGVHLVYDCCDGNALLVPADFVNSYAEDGCVEFGNDIADKIFAADRANVHPWNGWLSDDATDPDTHEVTRWNIGVNTKWKEPEETGTEDQAGKKYELTDDTVEVHGHTLYRIRAIRKITDPSAEGWIAKKGDLGGWIESEKNLSHEGAAWVGEDACVYGDAKVYDNAYVSGNARVYEDAKVYGNALVYRNAKVFGNAKVYDHARVFGSAQVYGNAEVYDSAWVSGNAQVYGDAEVYEDAQVYGDAKVYGSAWVCEDAEVCNDTEVCNTKPDEGDSTETPDLETRLATLEVRVETIAKDTEKNTRDMAKAIKDIMAIKKQLAEKKPAKSKKAKKRS